MVEDEVQTRFIGYGAMAMEFFVAIMALIAACVIEPGVYYGMNSPPGLIGTDAAKAASVISSWGFAITPDVLTQTAQNVGESTILSRAGGAPTLAVGMAHILSGFLGGQTLMVFWYHFAILFEALFILTTVDAGTRVCRFMIQDLLGTAVPALKNTRSWGASPREGLAVAAWGYFLYSGVTDPLGGINTLGRCSASQTRCWPRSRSALCTVVIFKMKREALRLGHDPADRLATDLHADRRPREAVPPEPGDRLHRPRQQVQRRRGSEPGVGPGQEHRGDAARRPQRLGRRGALRALRPGRRGDDLLRRRLDPSRPGHPVRYRARGGRRQPCLRSDQWRLCSASGPACARPRG